MLTVSFAQLQLWLAMFLWPFIRITAFLAAAPLLGHSSVPNQVKIGLAFFLTLVVSATLPPLPQVPVMSWAGVGIIAEQIVIGLALGLVMQIIFTVVEAAGEFIGLQMGLAFASFFAPDTGANTLILSRLLYMLTLLMFLAFDGHLMVIEILTSTFITLPVGFGNLDASAFDLLVRYASIIFSSGLLLAMPLVAALMVINMAMSILNRVAPQFTVFSVGFPMSLLAGIILLMVMMNDLGNFLQGLFSQGLIFAQQLMENMAGL
ncbi:MAG: flagellar biosynthetic protein FliR [Pseudomonadales bacterium]|nr:flagellar biosynthetic protein FliR [Pseudomonadales bacterium]